MFSAGRSIPVALPKPQSISIFCSNWTGAFGLVTVSALRLSACQIW